jgi:SAM-dependent methyltransferase
MDLLLNNNQTRKLHSAKFLNEVETHPDLMLSINSVLDVECGEGYDSEWWATRYDIWTDPKNPTPLDINVTSVSRVDEISAEVKNLDNVNYQQTAKEFWMNLPDKKFDVVWCHSVLHKFSNFYNVLQEINKVQDQDGMLCVTVPKLHNIFYGEPDYRLYPDCHTDINIVNLIYGLALAGYDCKDAYFLQEKNSNLINALVYKNSENIYNLGEVTPYDLMEMDRLPPSMVQQLNKFGYVSNKNLFLSWLDGTLIDYSTI